MGPVPPRKGSVFRKKRHSQFELQSQTLLRKRRAASSGTVDFELCGGAGKGRDRSLKLNKKKKIVLKRRDTKSRVPAGNLKWNRDKRKVNAGLSETSGLKG